MHPSAYDLKSFYMTRSGRVVRRILNQHIQDLWPDTKGLRVLGCGYAVPYLMPFKDRCERSVAVMPAIGGAHHWPNAKGDKNLVCLSEQSALPFETNSIDRILMIHDLEYREWLEPNFQELWRVLKSSGRLLVVVPNRAGLWARADWSPFGQGRPFSASQICSALKDNRFIHERTQEALFVPPFRAQTILKMAGLFERLGQGGVPLPAGVHIVEAGKQLYARADKGRGAAVPVRGRGMLLPKPAIRQISSRTRSGEI
ncbi:MAG: methyltransferase domain-containing protein [Bdellovibrionales bacterium]